MLSWVGSIAMLDGTPMILKVGDGGHQLYGRPFGGSFRRSQSCLNSGNFVLGLVANFSEELAYSHRE